MVLSPFLNFGYTILYLKVPSILEACSLSLFSLKCSADNHSLEIQKHIALVNIIQIYSKILFNCINLPHFLISFIFKLVLIAFTHFNVYLNFFFT